MGIEIPGGPAGTGTVGGIAQAGEPAVPEASAAATAPEGILGGDTVARVAEELAAGRISGDEAVQILLDDALNDPLVRAAPESLRAEIAEALAALLATDPHLAALARSLGAQTEL